MKLFSRLSLRWRVTLLTAGILAACSCAFTVFSIHNAQQMLYPVLENSDIAYPVEEGEAATPIPAIPATERKELFDHRSIYFCILVTVLGTVAVWFVSGRALRPIKQLNETVRLIDEHNLSERLKEPNVNDEVGQLTDSFNRMLSRLQEAFERQKRFTANAAHELKTPLATVKAGIQVLERDESADLQDYKENSQVIMKSVDRLTGVVNDLLMLACAQESEQNLSESIELDVMLEAILSDISTLYEDSGITYELDLQETVINGNAGMLYRAFYNLIENAYKYNRKNGSVFLKSYSDNSTVFIEISDTGMGISPEHRELIFEAFYRVDASRSRKTAGAGLGLSLVKAIAEQHGGDVTLESRDGAGSTFTMVISK